MTPVRRLSSACVVALALGTLAACGDDPAAPDAGSTTAAADTPGDDAADECGGAPPTAGEVETPRAATYRSGSFAAEIELSDGTTRCVTSDAAVESGFEFGSYHVEVGDFDDARLTIDQLDDAGNRLAAGTISPVVRLDVDRRSYLTSYERDECEVTLLSFTATETSGTFVCEELGEYTTDDPDSDFLDAVPGGSLPRATGWWTAAR